MAQVLTPILLDWPYFIPINAHLTMEVNEKSPCQAEVGGGDSWEAGPNNSMHEPSLQHTARYISLLIIGVSLSEPHNSVTSLRCACVSLLGSCNYCKF